MNAAGGDPDRAEEAYKAQRSERAAEASKAADEQARRVLLREALRRV
jgi:hypothetical protein